MRTEFNDPHFSRRIESRNLQPASADALSIRRIQTVVTRELFRHCHFPIRSMRQGPRHERYRLRGPHQGAGQLINHQARGLWSGFFVFSVLDPKDIARILDQSMLKTSSRAEKGPVLFTRPLNGLERSAHAFVRTAWRTPQGVKVL